MSEIISLQDIIAWCDKQVQEGRLLELCWEGGGDSGWVFFELDGESADGEEISTLVDMMYKELDYGSWAGEYSANGRAEYNTETKCFEGIDYYSEDDWDTLNLSEPIQVFIPKSLGFDSLEYNVTGNGDEDLTVDVAFNIINGFITPELRILEEEISEHVTTKISEAFAKIDVNYFNEHEMIDRITMDAKNDSLVFEITKVEYSTYETSENDVCLDLKELLDNEENNE